MQQLHPDLAAEALFSELASDWALRIPTIQAAARHAALRPFTASSSASASPARTNQPAAAETSALHTSAAASSEDASQQAVHEPQDAQGLSAREPCRPRAQTHCFEFAASNPDHPGQPVSHTADLPYAFGTLNAKHQGIHRLAPERSPQVEELSERMQNAWVSFCQCGDPKWGCAGWETSCPVQRVWSLPDQQGQHQTPPLAGQHAVWDGFNFDPLQMPSLQGC